MIRAWRAGLALALLLAGCGGKDARSPAGTDHRGDPSTQKGTGENAVAGYMVASVGERTLGPFLARRGSGPTAAGLVAWVTVAEGQQRRVLVVPVGPKGSPRGAEAVAAFVPIDTTMLVVRPMRGSSPGFLVAWTSLTDRGKSLWFVTVGDDGAPRSKPVELTRSNDDIVWIDAVPTEHGALCLWAEETRGNDANLVAASIDADGKVRGAPTRVARGIVGWHALELPNGIAVSTVDAAPPDPKAKPTETRLLRDARPGGTLSFHRLDVDGHETAAPITVTNKPTVSGDVEVVRDGSRFVFAWTDRSTTEPAVTVAALEGNNVAVPPRRVAESQGGASLQALAGGPAGVAVMFEAPARRKGESRRVHVSRINESLSLTRPLTFDVVGRGQPALAATTSGFAMLATTADCERDSPACVNADAVTTLFRTDAQNNLLQREPLTFLSDPATLGWGLTCEGDACFALAASPGPPGTPSRVRSVTIHPRSNIKVAAAKPAEQRPTDGPRIVDVTAVVSGESVVDIATARFGDTSLVATLSSKPSKEGGLVAHEARAPEGRAEPNRRPSFDEARSAPVTLSTRVVDDSGAPQAPSIITNKALHVGGVAIAGAEKPDDGGAIAWVGRENGDPEVHITRVDKRGRRTNDVQLTTTKGDATDVTITWAGNGWIVAWVDGRDGNGEVYATKVATDLSHGREERITKAPGDASDLVALANGDAVWLAWSDSRESPKDGIADVFVSAVKMKDAKRVFDEQRVLATAAHSRTPHLASGAGGVYVAWVEEAPLGSETPGASGYGAFWTKLEATGKPAGKPLRVPLAGEGAATSVVIDSDPNLHAVVARSTPEAIMLDAVDLSASPVKASSLIVLDGPPSLDVALVLDRGVLYFNDEGPQLVDRRARRARIAWQGR